MGINTKADILFLGDAPYANIMTLKEFLKLRDKDAAFNEAKENGYSGIPALIADDGRITLDWESYFTEHGLEAEKPGEAGSACRVDGKKWED